MIVDSGKSEVNGDGDFGGGEEERVEIEVVQ
jgi:hypothetical protein